MIFAVPPKAVVFDMDGVLVQSERRNFLAKNAVLQRFSRQIDYDYYSQFPGNSDLFVWERIIRDLSLCASAQELHELDLAERDRLITEQGHIAVDGAVELVRRTAEKYPLALASGSPMYIIKDAMNALGISSCFKFLLSGEDMEHCKPAPDIYIAAAKGLGVECEHCVAVEDSHNGVLSAKSAGFRCVGFVNPDSGNQELSAADAIVSSLDEIIF